MWRCHKAEKQCDYCVTLIIIEFSPGIPPTIYFWKMSVWSAWMQTPEIVTKQVITISCNEFVLLPHCATTLFVTADFDTHVIITGCQRETRWRDSAWNNVTPVDLLAATTLSPAGNYCQKRFFWCQLQPISDLFGCCLSYDVFSGASSWLRTCKVLPHYCACARNRRPAIPDSGCFS